MSTFSTRPNKNGRAAWACSFAAAIALLAGNLQPAFAGEAMSLLAPSESARKAETEATPVPVQQLDGVASDDGVRVVVRSYETAAIGAELNARITYLPQREGDSFRKGDILVAFDCRRLDAERAAAQAGFRAKQAEYEMQQQMHRYQAAGSLAVTQARFDAERALAEVSALEVRRTGCTIVAPFDGRVIEKAAQVHEIAEPNQPLLRIINESKLELVLMVPSAWLADFRAGTVFSVQLDESGEIQQARIVQSTGLIDPVSQSARLIAELITPSARVIPGMSGTARFARPEGQP